MKITFQREVSGGGLTKVLDPQGPHLHQTFHGEVCKTSQWKQTFTIIGFCWQSNMFIGGPHRGRSGTEARSASPETARHSHLWRALTPEFFGHRLQTSMTRATVEESTAGLGQTLRTGRPLVGGLSFHGFSRLCTNQWHKGGNFRGG